MTLRYMEGRRGNLDLWSILPRKDAPTGNLVLVGTAHPTIEIHLRRGRACPARWKDAPTLLERLLGSAATLALRRGEGQGEGIHPVSVILNEVKNLVEILRRYLRMTGYHYLLLTTYW